MAEDLSDAKAALNWASHQIPVLENRIQTWRDSPAYKIEIDTQITPGKKTYRLTETKKLDPIINAETGAIINNIRSSLDLLVSALAVRSTGKSYRDVYFPVCEDKNAFEKDGIKKISRLRDTDKEAIVNLRPYKGGNDNLYALHKLDITRKHNRLLDALLFPRGLQVLNIRTSDLSFPDKIGEIKDGTIIAWTDADISDGKLSFGLQVGFNEVGPVEGCQVTGTLRTFLKVASSVVSQFE